MTLLFTKLRTRKLDIYLVPLRRIAVGNTAGGADVHVNGNMILHNDHHDKNCEQFYDDDDDECPAVAPPA